MVRLKALYTNDTGLVVPVHDQDLGDVSLDRRVDEVYRTSAVSILRQHVHSVAILTIPEGVGLWGLVSHPHTGPEDLRLQPTGRLSFHCSISATLPTVLSGQSACSMPWTWRYPSTSGPKLPPVGAISSPTSTPYSYIHACVQLQPVTHVRERCTYTIAVAGCPV